MYDQPRWLQILVLLLALVALNVLGKIYHQWALGIVAAVLTIVVAAAAYHFASTRRSARPKSVAQHAVIVHLDGTGLPAETYQQHDLSSIETELESIIEAQDLGEYDGNEIGAGGAALFMYGPDGERLFKGVELALRAYPLCKNARVLIRPGPPGTPAREVRL